jgi:hypothetical protein
LVALTVQVSLTLPAVTVEPLNAQVPAVIAYVTAPVPLPPAVLSVDVGAEGFNSLGEAVTANGACATKEAPRVTVVV